MAHVNVVALGAGEVNLEEGLKIEEEELGVGAVPPPVFVTIFTITLIIFVIFGS